MYSFMGIGTTLYGKRHIESDGSYVATKWFILLLLPIIPLGSYRVIRGETKSTFIPGVIIGASTQYHLAKIPTAWSQVMATYAFVWGLIILTVLEFIYLQNVYVLLIPAMYLLYLLFKQDQKMWKILFFVCVLVVAVAYLIGR
ncbi:MAG: hypothetical protein JWL75_657 [Parcubacteria group bacterium]|nr:hypothetical protein [Parcubacteria group bacterium]